MIREQLFTAGPVIRCERCSGIFFVSSYSVTASYSSISSAYSDSLRVYFVEQFGLENFEVNEIVKRQIEEITNSSRILATHTDVE